MIKFSSGLGAALALAACSGALSNVPISTHTPQTQQPPIEHVVFVIQENRSFNDLFMGFPGATTATYGYNTRGRKITLRPRGLDTSWDMDHDSLGFFTECDGQGKLAGTNCKMDGWNKEPVSQVPPAPKDAPYSYVPHNQVAPYWAMAKEYVLADRMFASNLDGSFVSHQYAVAAYASHAIDSPLTTQWGCEGGPSDTVATLLKDRTDGDRIPACFGNPTVASEADAAGISWRFYAGALNSDGALWSSYQADKKIYNGPDWTADVINPPSQFLTDVGHGKLAAITWITPLAATSDHPGTNSNEGPAWVASVVNAVGASRFWNTTAIFIMWDDWGGFFDPVPPVFEDYDGLGFRVPLIIISPYAKQASVTHVQYETASVLRFIEDNFGLAQLAASDTRANDPANDPAVFDYRQTPRGFKKIPGAKPVSYWRRLEQSSQRDRETIVGDD